MDPIEENLNESMDKLLNIIILGDPEVILSDENNAGFKELMKYELITLVDGNVKLTPLGVEAQKIGVGTVIARLRLKPELPLASPVKLKNNRKLMISVLVFLSLLLLLSWGYLMAI